MEIVEVSVTGKTDIMSAKSGITVNVRVLNVNVYQRAGLVLRIEQIEDPDISPCEIGLLQITLLRASIHIYGFNYSCTAISVKFQPEESAKDVIIRLHGFMTAGAKLLNNRAKEELLDGPHCLQSVQQLYVECDIG